MIYKTNGIKQTRKYGRKSKRNMRGGKFNEGKWSVGLPILAVVSVVVFVILVALGIILRSGGGGRKTQ